MLSVSIDIGANLLSLLSPVAVGVVVWLNGRTTRKELKPNGGSSMRDAVDRIERTVKTLEVRMTEVERKADE